MSVANTESGLASLEGFQRVGRFDASNPSDLQEIDRILSESVRMGNRRADSAYEDRLMRFTEAWYDTLDGRRSTVWLREAMSTSDFPTLFGDVLDRELLGRYAEWVPSWAAYCRRGTVRDFRTARRIAIDGLEGRLYPTYLKPELTQADEAALSETGYTTSVEIYERAAALSFRAMVNDDLDAFGDIPVRFARSARRSEDYLAAELIADSSGPHASLYTAGNSNIINTGNGAASTNPALSVDGLQDGFTVLGNQTDSDSEPILIEQVTLVVPPALRITAKNILNSTELRPKTSGGATTAQELVTMNWMRNEVDMVVNPYLSIIDTTNGSTSWYLFAQPSTGRPSVELTFLRGYEQPAIYRKAADAVRVGGGVDQMIGDFETNEHKWKVMHILGGTRLDPLTTVASNGSGS